MNRRLMAVYHAMPPFVRAGMAMARGLQLRSWRYGPETDALVLEALARDRWTPQQWDAWRSERLAFVLERASSRVPYYRDYWDAHRGGNRRELSQWPVLPKGPLRAEPLRFLADDCHPRSMFPEHTSGTSGTPLRLWWSQETVRAWYALFEARCRRWYGVSRHDRWAILGGQMIVPFEQRKPPFWVWNAPMRQLYLSSYHIAPDLVSDYMSALERHRVEYVWGYTSALYALAEEMNRLKRRRPMRVVITNAEPLYPYQRSAIEQAFACPVRETYGMAEVVAAASECEKGTLHLWPEVGVVEASGEEMLCTGLLNADMPLIRYAIGDHLSLAPADTPLCACGRTLPIVARIEGRDDEMLYSRDGRSIGRLDPAFKSALPIREAQIVQETLEHIHVRYVPAPGFNSHAKTELADALRSRLGDVKVTFEALDEIPRTASGKFRGVITRVRRSSDRVACPQ